MGNKTADKRGGRGAETVGDSRTGRRGVFSQSQSAQSPFAVAGNRRMVGLRKRKPIIDSTGIDAVFAGMVVIPPHHKSHERKQQCAANAAKVRRGRSGIRTFVSREKHDYRQEMGYFFCISIARFVAHEFPQEFVCRRKRYPRIIRKTIPKARSAKEATQCLF